MAPCPDVAVTQAMELAGREGLQLLAHCNGDQAVAQFLRCLAAAEQKYPQLKTLRPVIVHGQLMGRDQLAQARDLGAMVSFFVAHVYHWGDVHLRNLGPARAAAISPAASALAAGLPFTFHQDAPVIQPDMFEDALVCHLPGNPRRRDPGPGGTDFSPGGPGGL